LFSSSADEVVAVTDVAAVVAVEAVVRCDAVDRIVRCLTPVVLLLLE
jgi:hypothetical protein